MSNLPQQVTINQYVGDGITTVYNYTYMILLNTDISVYVTQPGAPAIPEADLQVLNTDYSVQNAGNISGGTITFLLDAPVSSAIVTVVRNMEPSIDTQFVQVQTISGINLDNAFLREMLLIQEALTFIKQRCLTYAIDSYLPNLPANTTLPVITNLPNQFWQSMPGGAIIAATLVEGEDVSTLRSQLASEVPFGDGASIVGYYDTVNVAGTTVAAYLNSLFDTLDNQYIRTQMYVAGGTPNELTLTVPDSYTTYTFGSRFLFKATATNTSAATMNINSIGFPLDILTSDSMPLNPGAIQLEGIYEVVTNGIKMYLLNPTPNNPGFYGASATLIVNQTIPNDNILRTILFTTIVYDTSNLFSPGNHGFILSKTGYYAFNLIVPIVPSATMNGGPVYTALLVNGSAITYIGAECPFNKTSINGYLELFLIEGMTIQAQIGCDSNHTIVIRPSEAPPYFQIRYMGN